MYAELQRFGLGLEFVGMMFDERTEEQVIWTAVFGKETFARLWVVKVV